MAAVDTEIPITLRLPFLGLQKCGLFSTNALKRYFLPTVAAFCLGNLIIISMLQFMNIEKDLLVTFVRNLEAVASYTQILGKIFVTTYRINDFTSLMEMTHLFWRPTMCNKRNERKLNFIYTTIFQLQKLFLLITCIGVSFLMLVPFLEKTPALGIWTFEKHETLYRFVIVQQLIYMPSAAVVSSSLDCMYLGFCVEIIVQFEILCEYLEELIAEGNIFNELEIGYLNKTKTCIRHHQLLLRFIKKFRQAFSLILLFEYITVGPLACAELFATFESHSVQDQFRYGILFLILTMQLCLYCIPANYIADKVKSVIVLLFTRVYVYALAVADAIYFSNWYSQYFPSLRIPLLLMIQNAQHGIVINAGGLITINAQTVLNVLKVAWSASSIARRLKHQ